MNNFSWKNWYVWLSLLGFAWLWGKTIIDIQFGKGEKIIINDSKKFNLWLKALANLFGLVASYVVLVLFFSLLFNFVFGFLKFPVGLGEGLGLALLYFLGVYVAYKHDQWRKVNLS